MREMCEDEGCLEVSLRVYESGACPLLVEKGCEGVYDPGAEERCFSGNCESCLIYQNRTG